MYGLTKNQISKIVYQQTPIDTIISTDELPNGFKVTGYVGQQSKTYQIYQNGQVIEV